MFDWSQIDTVLLDMDGTLLDLHFDNHFWRQHVPVRFAAQQGISEDEARERLYRRYQDIQGTLEWYCVDHWSRELGLDIALLKEEVDHLIAVHPHVTDFLEALARAGKQRVLVTNAHQKSLQLKMRKTRLDELPQCFNVLKGEMSVIGPRPERPVFFSKLEAAIPFYTERTFGLRPGITGLAQVNQAYDASIEDVRNKVLYDHAYAARVTSWLEWLRTDLGIIASTVKVMALGKGQ